MNAYDITGKVLVNLRTNDTGNIIDLANIGTTWNSQGATVTTAQTKFGKYSIYGGTSHQYLESSTLDDALGNIGSNDLTISAWMNYEYSYYYDTLFAIYFTNNANTNNHTLSFAATNHDVAIGSNYVSGMWHNTWSATDKSLITTEDPSPFLGSDQIFAQNTWNHIAMTIKDGFARLFYNGKLIAYSGSKYYNNLQTNAAISSFNCHKIAIFENVSDITSSSMISSCGFNGYIDDFVIIRDQALWTSEFTPPTSYLYTPPDEIRKYLKQY